MHVDTTLTLAGHFSLSRQNHQRQSVEVSFSVTAGAQVINIQTYSMGESPPLEYVALLLWDISYLLDLICS